MKKQVVRRPSRVRFQDMLRKKNVLDIEVKLSEPRKSPIAQYKQERDSAECYRCGKTFKPNSLSLARNRCLIEHKVERIIRTSDKSYCCTGPGQSFSSLNETDAQSLIIIQVCGTVFSIPDGVMFDSSEFYKSLVHDNLTFRNLVIFGWMVLYRAT